MGRKPLSGRYFKYRGLAEVLRISPTNKDMWQHIVWARASWSNYASLADVNVNMLVEQTDYDQAVSGIPAPHRARCKELLARGT